MDYFDAGAVKDEAAAALGISGALLQADGWALEQVQALMGHASEAMTKVYLEGHEPPWIPVAPGITLPDRVVIG